MNNASNLDSIHVSSLAKRWGWISILYLAMLTYFWSFSKYGFNIWDEGGYANGTLRTLNGEKALIDFNPNGYLPGRYWYGVLFFKLFGVDIQSLRIGVLLITPPMILMIYSIGRKIMPAGFALLAALCMLSAPSMYYNRFFTFFVVLNLYLFTNFLYKKNLKSLVGLCLGIFLGAFFKFEVTLFSMLISLTVLGLMFSQKQWRSHLLQEKKTTINNYYLVGGVSITAIFCGIYLGIDSYFTQVLKMVIDAHKVWGNPFPEIFPFLTLLKEAGYHQMFERVLFYLPILTFIVITVLLFYQLVHKKESLELDKLIVISILLFGVCAFGLVIWRAGFDNLLRTLPPFYLLFCYLLYRIREKILHLQNPDGQKSLFTRLPLNLLTVFLPFLFYFEMNTHHGFYAGSIGALKLENTRLSLDKADIYTNPAEAKWIKKVIEKIDLYTREEEAILALPLNPIFYFLSGRVNPTPYEWVLPGMLEQAKEKELVEILKNNPPQLVIFVDIAIDGKEERRLINYAPQLYKFLIGRYRFKEQVGFFQLLLPKNSPPSSDF